MSIVRLTTCENSIEAQRIIDLLKDSGIECFTTNENFTALLPQYNGLMGAGIQIMIDDRDIEIAKKILLDERPEKINQCPECQSVNIGVKLSGNNSITLKIIYVLYSLVLGEPFGNVKPINYCKSCKAEF